ncbi:hypothetical protein FIV02_08900 [Pseudomonas sp. THAF187a]|nr:hypothetical protein FIV02_08900 [Pseudomonas sp. THAF187a]QFT41882.1 hypothetical protein FIU98_08880 [Pseudomonas sp. THAF42]
MHRRIVKPSPGSSGGRRIQVDNRLAQPSQVSQPSAEFARAATGACC